MLGDGSVLQRKHPFIYCETGVPILIIVVTEPKSKLDWYKTVQPVEKHTAALYSQTCQDLLLAFRIWSYGSKHDSEVKNVPLKKKSSEQLNQKCKKMKIYSFQYLSLFFFFYHDCITLILFSLYLLKIKVNVLFAQLVSRWLKCIYGKKLFRIWTVRFSFTLWHWYPNVGKSLISFIAVAMW